MTQLATRYAVRHHDRIKPRLVAVALRIDHALYLACELLGRTTNPLLIVALLATSLFHHLQGRSIDWPILPHFE